jgi:hypothetical protein
MTRATKTRVLVETAALVIVLVPLHFFLQRPGPTAWGTVAALLVFFVPAVLAVARIRPGPRAVASEALAGLVFGFGLGLLAGGLGGLGRAVLHAVTGDPLPVRLALWVAIAAAWTLATAVAYGLILFLVSALRLAVGSAPAEGAGGVRVEPRPGLAHRILPGLHRPAGARPGPAARLLRATALSGIAGVAIAMAGLVVLREGHASGLALLALGALLLGTAMVLRAATARRVR